MNSGAAGGGIDALPITVIDLASIFLLSPLTASMFSLTSPTSSLPFVRKHFNFSICIQSTRPITLSLDTCSNSRSADEDVAKSTAGMVHLVCVVCVCGCLEV